MTEPIAYLVSRYPYISHTFIQREVEELRRQGLGLRTVAIRPTDPSAILSEADREAQRTTATVLPPSASALWRGALDVVRHPSSFAALVRFSLSRAGPGARAKVWQCFYCAEAALLWRLLEPDGVHHVHAHFANVGCDVARLWARWANVMAPGERHTWSFTMHGSSEYSNVRGHDLVGKTSDADLVVCISEFTRTQLLKLVPGDSWGRLPVVHCGIDTACFVPVDRRHRTGPVELLTVGRLDPVKGIPILLHALRLLLDQGRDVRLRLVGSGPERDALGRIAERLAVADRVRFVGSVGQDEIRRHYDEVDVFCLPSFEEGIPVVLMEAMASGLPVVTSRIAGIPELVEHGRSGALVTPGRADLLAEAIDAYVTSPEARHAAGQAGRRRVQQDFELAPCAAQLRELLLDVTTRPAAAAGPGATPPA
ncbi:MAG: glycosyltransferase family 4 protein [Acidobacteria bacterium]|nr:glycosyltransferase family 4 protein [Acidobacteriota bacterium]